MEKNYATALDRISHARYRQLCYLDLSDLDLDILPGEMSGWTGLSHLNLNFNPFAQFPVPVCQLSALKILQLVDTGLTELPADIAQLTSLEELDLTGNALQTLTPQIGQLRHLRSLALTSRSVPLKTLNCSKCPIIG